MNRVQQEIHDSITSQKVFGDADGAQMTVRLTPEFIGFSGHFPERPVLPAIVQIMLGRTLVELWQGKAVVLEGVERAKFMAQLGPDQDIRVHCEKKQGKSGMRYAVKLFTHVDDALAASFFLIGNQE